jgi:UDP-glucuronate 4-epimerase
MPRDPILITGTAGFIGFHLARKLLADGQPVVEVDNFNDYYDPALKEARNKVLEGLPGFTSVRGDLADLQLVRRLFGEHRFADVVHLAAQAGVRYSLTNPFAYVQANLVAFLNILEAVRHSDCARLVYASSSSVYGGNKKLPFSENDRVDNPVSLYAATKKSNELIAHSYSHLYGIQTVGLRFFTVYGPWGRPDMAMWIFADKISNGMPIPVFNHGNMRRDFTYVDDIVAGLQGVLRAEDLGPYEIFNLGNNRSERLLDMIAEIEKALGIKATLDMQPMQPGDVPATFADVGRAAEKLGYAPTTPITEGVPRFVEWFREYHRQ